MSESRLGTKGQSLDAAFILPVKSPSNASSNDYDVVERLLRASVVSTLRQTSPDILIVVCCHVVPVWADQVDHRAHFLDVSGGSEISREHGRIFDIGWKRVLGALYAWRVGGPTHLVMSDADDYVRVDLCERLQDFQPSPDSSDGYLMVRGAETQVRLGPDRSLRYDFAIEVQDFDVLCGTCRAFKTGSIISKVRSEFPTTLSAFIAWAEGSASRIRKVPGEILDSLWLEAGGQSRGAQALIPVLGRHVRQAPYFDLMPLDFIGAAKACGHGNHAGPKLGRVHWRRAIRPLPRRDFARMFGLQEDSVSKLDSLYRIKAQIADRAPFRTLTKTRASPTDGEQTVG